MTKIQEFNFDLQGSLRTEASEGFCNKWVIRKRDKTGKLYTFWIKIGANDWSGFYDHQSLGEYLYYQVAKDLGLEKYVLQYHLCIVNVKDSTGKVIPTLGCYSLGMNRENEEVITLDKLDMERTLEYDGEGETEYKDLILSLNKRTEIPIGSIRAWLDVCILLDSLTVNTDRRYGNLAVIRNKDTGKFRLAPLFDNGQIFMLRDNLCNIYEWNNFNIINQGLYSRLLFRGNFHDYELALTHFYQMEQGKKELNILATKEFSNTKNSLDAVYKIFGSGIDNSWNDEIKQEVKTIRKEVYPAIELKEKNFIMNALLDRFETVINQKRPDFIPRTPSEYDKEVYSGYYKYFK